MWDYKIKGRKTIHMAIKIEILVDPFLPCALGKARKRQLKNGHGLSILQFERNHESAGIREQA